MSSVFLGMPHRGNVTAGSVAAIGWATASHDISFRMHSTSLLAQCFNSLWCEVLNSPGKYDYFAMLHDDVQPEQLWLDTLIETLEINNADMVSCVVPIRDGRGLTSTAVLDPVTNRLRRLTVRECLSFPSVFDAAKAGFPGQLLMLNTGCWVFRVRQKWDIAEMMFRVSDRIIRDAKGTYLAQSYPEDWQWSRDLHSHGCKLLATTGVKLYHEGPHRYSNSTPWGEWGSDRASITFDPPADMAEYPEADQEVLL